MLPGAVQVAIDRYLDRIDRALPGRLEGFYVVGSTALGAFHPGRSDIDFVGVFGSPLGGPELARLETVQARLYRHNLARSATHLPWRWPLVCNGVFVEWRDLTTPPESVVPVASHSAGRFAAGRGFDVNPVTWHILATRGISVRGPDPRQLGVHTNDAELRRWTRANLDTYWRRWARTVAGISWPAAQALVSHYVAWGVLGVARMQFTICTAQVASKEEAGAYALEVSAPKWHPLIRATLAYWRGQQPAIAYRNPPARRRDAAAFAAHVVEWAARA